jgi:hypothetical protein
MGRGRRVAWRGRGMSCSPLGQTQETPRAGGMFLLSLGPWERSTSNMASQSPLPHDEVQRWLSVPSHQGAEYSVPMESKGWGRVRCPKCKNQMTRGISDIGANRTRKVHLHLSGQVADASGSDHRSRRTQSMGHKPITHEDTCTAFLSRCFYSQIAFIWVELCSLIPGP